MSLLITSNTPENDFATETKGLNRPYSYRNNLNDTLKIPAKSKVAVESVKINKSGNLSINRGTQFGIYFGENIVSPQDNENVLSLTAPTYILEDNENNFTGNTDDIAEKIQTAGNRALWHPNLCKTTNGTTNPGFTCVTNRNASTLDFLGFKFGITHTDETKNASNISANWTAVDDLSELATYNSTTRVLTNGTGIDRAFVGTDYPLNLTNGSFSCSISVSASATFTELGLCRYLKVSDDGNSMVQPPYSAENAEDYFDYLVRIETGGDIKLLHSYNTSLAPNPVNFTQQEINYGTTLNCVTDKVDRITFAVSGEQVSVIAFASSTATTTILANGQNASGLKNLKPISQTTRWLYPKIYLRATKTIGINHFIGVDVNKLDYFGLAPQYVGTDPTDTITPQNQIGLDWWKYVIETNVPDLLYYATQIDIGAGFTKMTSRLSQIGLDADKQINYTPTMILAPANNYLLTDSLNSQYLFGFQGRSLVNVPTSTGPASPYTETFISDSVPELKATNSLFVRLKNFTHNSVNFAKSSSSKIIYHIPSFSNSGESTGALYFSPTERVYIDLNNPQDLYVSDIQLDICHDDETLANELQGKTTIVLHIIQ